MEYIIEFYERLFILNYLNVPERVRKLDRIHDPARSSHRDPLAPPSTPLFSLKDAAFTARWISRVRANPFTCSTRITPQKLTCFATTTSDRNLK